MADAMQKAVEESKFLKGTPSPSDLLRVYGLYKVSMGQDFAAEPKPGTFDLKAKAKYASWKKLVDDGVTQAQAQEQYIALVEELKAKYGFDPTQTPRPLGALA